MQSWRIIILICLVNFSTVAFASDSGTPIRGPKALDQQSRIQQLGPISSSDTLWRLAQQIRPEAGVDMYQVMYALYLKNPNAFLDNNFNHLRTGAMLDVPSLREMRAVDPALARQKSAADDQSWARRVQAAQTEAEQAPAAVDQQLQQSIERLEQEQAQQLQQLRYRFGESMMLVEGMMEENITIKHTLDAVQQQLDQLKLQLEQDALVQQQLEALVREQGEWVAQQQALLEAEAEQGFSAFWQQLAANPVFWAVAASVPALALLLALLVWVKRRSKRAEATIEAATSEQAPSENYQSPLPDVDDSSDVDDSLFSLDDSLLDDAFNDDVDDSPVDLSDDLLDDDLLDDNNTADDDGLFDEDDALLDDDSLLDAESLLDDETADSPEPVENDATTDATTEAADKDFDPDNILSGNDLDSLFAESDEADDELEPNEQPNDAESFEEDELLEEIELDIPDDDLPESDEATTEDDFSQWVDEAEESEDTDEDTDDEGEVPAESVEALDDETSKQDSELQQPDEDEERFDSSELDAFAESLVEETLSDDAELQQSTELDEDELSSSVQDAMSTVEEEGVAESNDSVTEPAEAEDMDDADIDALFAAATDEESDGEQATQEDFAATESEDEASEQKTEAEVEAEYLNDYADLEDEYPADEGVEADSEQGPDLIDQDDDSVTPLSAAARSVENPSEVLDDYPELELNEQDHSPDEASEADEPDVETTEPSEPASVDDDAEISDEPETGAANAADEADEPDVETTEPSEPASADDDAEMSDEPKTGAANTADEADEPDVETTEPSEPASADDDVEMSDEPETGALNAADEADGEASDLAQDLGDAELDNTDFDELLSELEDMAQRVATHDATDDSEAVDIDSGVEKQVSDDDFQDIDQLLAQASDKASDDHDEFTMDVDVSDFQDMLAADSTPSEHDNEYAAQLDLIRAYYEIDDHDSAEQAIQAILASDAPDSIKEEVKQLQASNPGEKPA